MVPYRSRQSHFTDQVCEDKSDMSYQKDRKNHEIYSLRNSRMNDALASQDPQGVSAPLGKTNCVDCIKTACVL